MNAKKLRTKLRTQPDRKVDPICIAKLSKRSWAKCTYCLESCCRQWYHRNVPGLATSICPAKRQWKSSIMSVDQRMCSAKYWPWFTGNHHRFCHQYYARQRQPGTQKSPKCHCRSPPIFRQHGLFFNGLHRFTQHPKSHRSDPRKCWSSHYFSINSDLV